MNDQMNQGAVSVGIGRFRPCLRMYHANPKGTGCAVKMELHPAHDDVDGSIMLTLANQMTVGGVQGAARVFATFDWMNSICVKLDFSDLCKMLQVLRGECESIDEGRGLFHSAPTGTKKISFRHLLDPVTGYSLDVTSSACRGGAESHAHFLFSDSEALGLCESISGSMSIVSFGIPVVIPHDTSAYVAECRRARNVPAS